MIYAVYIIALIAFVHVIRDWWKNSDTWNQSEKNFFGITLLLLAIPYLNFGASLFIFWIKYFKKK